MSDITVPTATGFLYLAIVLDAWSRKIVGWAMASHLHTELVLDALEMAIGQRRSKGVVLHADQGSQSSSLALGMRCKEAGVRPSIGLVGDAYDNAPPPAAAGVSCEDRIDRLRSMAESFFASLACELLARRKFTAQAEAKMACFSYIEGSYNPQRLLSALGYRSPNNCEEQQALASSATTDEDPETVH